MHISQFRRDKNIRLAIVNVDFTPQTVHFQVFYTFRNLERNRDRVNILWCVCGKYQDTVVAPDRNRPRIQTCNISMKFAIYMDLPVRRSADLDTALWHTQNDALGAFQSDCFVKISYVEVGCLRSHSLSLSFYDTTEPFF
jgi:hypothetical protein